jgi:hypothetical protein
MNGNITQETLRLVIKELEERLFATTEEAFLLENMENTKFLFYAGKRAAYQDALSRLIFKFEELSQTNWDIYGDEDEEGRK